MPDTNEAIQEAVEDITSQLQETHPPAKLQIRRVIEQIGIETTYELLGKALEVEAQGGMLTHDKKRQRTPGGTFFYIVRGYLSPDLRRLLWPTWQEKKKALQESADAAKGAPNRSAGTAKAGESKGKSLPSSLPWDQRERLAAPALAEKGEARTVKITLVGRPGKVIERPDAVILTMTGPNPPALPKGLPVLPETAVTVFLVYVARKQWQKVAPSLQNPEDKLIIEGYPFMDAKLSVIGVLTQNVNTVLLQRAARPSA